MSLMCELRWALNLQGAGATEIEDLVIITEIYIKRQIEIEIKLKLLYASLSFT